MGHFIHNVQMSLMAKVTKQAVRGYLSKQLIWQTKIAQTWVNDHKVWDSKKFDLLFHKCVAVTSYTTWNHDSIWFPRSVPSDRSCPIIIKLWPQHQKIDLNEKTFYAFSSWHQILNGLHEFWGHSQLKKQKLRSDLSPIAKGWGYQSAEWNICKAMRLFFS